MAEMSTNVNGGGVDHLQVFYNCFFNDNLIIPKLI